MSHFRVLCVMLALVCSALAAEKTPVQGTRTVHAMTANQRLDVGVRVETFSHGVKLTLTGPKRVFGTDEIAQLTVRVENLSHRSLVPEVSCDLQNPRVEVQSRTGFTLYPPAVGYPTAPSCRSVRPAPLRPGATLVTRRYDIVHAHYLQAAVLLAPERVTTVARQPGPFFVVRTRLIQVTLVPRDKPAVQLCSYSNLCANVEPPFEPAGIRIRGPLLYAFTAQCDSGQIRRNFQSVWLHAAPRNDVFKPPRYRIYPGCARPAEWNFVVGWVGTPVAHIHFVRRGGSKVLKIASAIAASIPRAGTVLANVRPRTVVYQADRVHRWAGWHAPGWRVRQGVLMSSGTENAIRVPYVPSEHGVGKYLVRVELHDTETTDPGGFGIIVNGGGQRGDEFSVCCSGGEFLTIRGLPSEKMLASSDADGLDTTQAGTYYVYVRAGHVLGTFAGNQPSVRAHDRRNLRGGFIAIHAINEVALTVNSVQITAL